MPPTDEKNPRPHGNADRQNARKERPYRTGNDQKSFFFVVVTTKSFR